MSLTQISEHVYWMPPGKPDRPSLCAVVGSEYTLMLDAGSSDAHAQLFLSELATLGLRKPQMVALTHWHWDHVFGAAELGVPVIAHNQTAQKLEALATRDWSDAGLEHHIALGEQTLAGAEHIKTELPAPRTIRIAQATITFEALMNLKLGGVTCKIEHVGGDHAADSSVMYIEPDRVLFLGDCLYEAIYAPKRHYTIEKLDYLLEAVSSFKANYYIEGHGPEILTKSQFKDLFGKMNRAMLLVDKYGVDEAAVFAAFEAKTGAQPDEDSIDFIRSLIAGIELQS